MRKGFISAILFVLMISLLVGTLGIFSCAVAGNGITVEGAQIRTEGIQGLRFVAKVDRSKFSLTTGADANFGILLIPANMVGNGEEITVDTETVKVVKARNLMSQTDEYYEFTAVLLDIPAEFYGTEIIARAYVQQGENYTYSNQLTRSVKFVAEAILKDNDATSTDISVANNVLRICDEVGNDRLIDAEEIWNGPSKLITYPEYPDQIARDHMYSVSVAQKSVEEELVVYNQTEAFFYQDRFEGGDVNRRFCEFAFSGKAVTVNVKVNTDFSTYSVVPTSKGFESTYRDGVISITMDKPEQLVVILDGDVNTALSIFADAPETDIPNKNDSRVIYVEGWNDFDINGSYATYENGVLTIKEDYVTVYVAPGAVLTARIQTADHRDENDSNGDGTSRYLDIIGRGIILDPLSGIYDKYDQAYNYSSTTPPTSLVRVKGVYCNIKDVKLLDARCFNLNIDGEMNVVDNVKILSTMMTSDGITTTTNSWGDGIVKNCFIYCGDNAIVTQSYGGTGYSFENITIGTTCSAIYPQYECYNSTFTDIYVFRADEGLVSFKHGTDAKTIVINNLDALDCVRTPWLFYAEAQGSGQKTITMNKVLMRYTTGSDNVSASVATSTQNSTLFKGNALSAGSNYTFNITDLYVGGNLITSDNQVKTSNLSATKSYFSSGADYSAMSGESVTANYIYDKKLIVGSREVFLGDEPVKLSGEWYLPYNDIAHIFSVDLKDAATITLGGVKYISIAELKVQGAITDGEYNNSIKAIKMTAAVYPTVNLLTEDTGFKSNYDKMYYNDKTTYINAVEENETWVYNAKSASSDGGIMRMILDVYKQYGAGTYTISFEYKSSSRVTVCLGVNHNKSKQSSTLSSSSGSWRSGTVSFTISENPDSVNQMAICFKVSSGNTISLKNIKLVKAN